MNDIHIHNWAMGLALFSFAFLSLGSIFFGATVTTGVLRGLGGGILFGVLIWLVGGIVNKEENSIDGTTEDEDVTSSDSITAKDHQMESRDK